jgi:hypothetical protein
MYCSTCGVAIAESLSYCNHCGARVSGSHRDNANLSRDLNPGFLVYAMLATFIFGLVAITLLLGVMKSVLGLEVGQILGFAVLSFLIMLFLEGVFLSLLIRRNRSAEDRARTELMGHHTKELAAPQLQEPLSSVTDHTTRAFDPIYTNRNNVT